MTIEIEGIDEALKEFANVEKEILKNVKQALVSSGNLLKKTMTDSMQKEAKTGRIYQRGGVSHQASDDGQPPAVDTGRLVGSIGVFPNLTQFEIEAGVKQPMVEYAQWLEFGSRRMEERPFIRPAEVKAAPAIREKFRKAIDRAIKTGAKNG